MDWMHTNGSEVSFKIWEEVFGGHDRFVRVLPSQAGNTAVSEGMLGFRDAAQHADALAIAPYMPYSIGRGKTADLGPQMKDWTVDQMLDHFEKTAWTDSLERMRRGKAVADKYGVKLIGYFYLDCPTWIHTRPGTEWKGPMFDPERLKTESGRLELRALATRYYRITHEAIRRYDPHHLILGDRYEAGQPIADEVIAAALPFVDVLSFQHFSSPEKVVTNLTHWHNKTGKPVLLADHAAVIKHADGSQSHDGAGYAAMLKTLRGLPGCVGYHLCGAYLRNETRKRALRDATEQPDAEALQILTEANHDAATWMRRTNQEQLPKH